jgi:hypothetical protein
VRFKRSVPAYRACFAKRRDVVRFAPWALLQSRTGLRCLGCGMISPRNNLRAKISPHSLSLPETGWVLQDENRRPMCALFREPEFFGVDPKKAPPRNASGGLRCGVWSQGVRRKRGRHNALRIAFFAMSARYPFSPRTFLGRAPKNSPFFSAPKKPKKSPPSAPDPGGQGFRLDAIRGGSQNRGLDDWHGPQWVFANLRLLGPAVCRPSPPPSATGFMVETWA